LHLNQGIGNRFSRAVKDSDLQTAGCSACFLRWRQTGATES
jgi:hypothetical protein